MNPKPLSVRPFFSHSSELELTQPSHSKSFRHLSLSVTPTGVDSSSLPLPFLRLERRDGEAPVECRADVCCTSRNVSYVFGGMKVFCDFEARLVRYTQHCGVVFSLKDGQNCKQFCSGQV